MMKDDETGIGLVPICMNCSKVVGNLNYNENLISISLRAGELIPAGIDIHFKPERCPHCGKKFVNFDYPREDDFIGPVSFNFSI